MHQPHRKKLKHYDLPGHAHGFTFSCYRRMPLLSQVCICRWTLAALDRAMTKFTLALWAYVLMPEHVHVLVYPRAPGYSSAAYLHFIKKSSGQRALNFLRKQDPVFLEKLACFESGAKVYRFWQHSGGFDQNQTEPAAIHAMIEYIHQNPVRRGLVSRAEDWPWSSARAWADGGDEPATNRSRCAKLAKELGRLAAPCDGSLPSAQVSGVPLTCGTNHYESKLTWGTGQELSPPDHRASG